MKSCDHSETAAGVTRRVHRLLYIGHPDSHVPGFEVPAIVAAAPTRRALLVSLLVAAGAAIAGFVLDHASHGIPDAAVALPWVAPFAALLGAIAIMPFLAKAWWEHNYARVSLALGALVAAYYLFFVQHGPGNVARAAAEYISFIFLLGSLFIVSGGILIRVRARATPTANVAILLVGAIIANFFGTTGASMLLIRPFLRLNKGHLRAYHVVFFIFIVANAGGSLTPIGDPPLFLGYLKGVPFFWVFENCWPIWAVAIATLLAVFFVVDTLSGRRKAKSGYDGDDFGPTVSFYGGVNLIFIVMILAGILLHTSINHYTLALFGFEGPWRELIMATAAVASLATTPRRVHAENFFNYAPIKEVAFIFVGIFMTMIPALNYLYHRANAGGTFLHSPGQYFFACGGLSSVLDNAPTYLTFLKSQMGSLDTELVNRATAAVKRADATLTADDTRGLTEQDAAKLRGAVDTLKRYHGDRLSVAAPTDDEVRLSFLIGNDTLSRYLIAISMGAVLFGACTYIGNGPNFMVKSIAEHAGAEVPTFFGYIGKFTVPVLLPILVVIWLVFIN